MSNSRINELCDVVRESALRLHKHLRHTHVEKIHKHGLARCLSKAGVLVEKQSPVPVFDEDGTLPGQKELIVELKAVRAVTDNHFAQLLGYLGSRGKHFGLLINFGSPKVHIKRYVLNPVHRSYCAFSCLFLTNRS